MRKSLVFVPTLILTVVCFVFLMSDSGFWLARSAAAMEEHGEGGHEPSGSHGEAAPAEPAHEEQAAPARKKVSFAKDLQVMDFKDMLELQTYMKTITESLGVTCKFCHNLQDFAQTDPKLHKDEARGMMIATKQINEQFFKESEEKITCFTCHRGHEHPANTKDAWTKQMGEKAGQ